MIKYDLSVQELHTPMGTWSLRAHVQFAKLWVLFLILFSLYIQGHHLLSPFLCNNVKLKEWEPWKEDQFVSKTTAMGLREGWRSAQKIKVDFIYQVNKSKAHTFILHSTACSRSMVVIIVLPGYWRTITSWSWKRSRRICTFLWAVSKTIVWVNSPRASNIETANWFIVVSSPLLADKRNGWIFFLIKLFHYLCQSP